MSRLSEASRPPARRLSETAAHLELKRLALAWAAERRLLLAATEVRLPRSGYRADVVAATPRVLADNAVTAVFECKASRADFLRDSAREAGAAELLARMSERLMALRALIGISAHEWESEGVRILGLLPAPLASAFRRKAFVGEPIDGLVQPARYAQLATWILAQAPAAWSGCVVDARQLPASEH